MESVPAAKQPRRRLGLRGLIGGLVVLAVAFAALRPLLREPLDRLERYVRVRLNERDLYRHVNGIVGASEKFARAMHDGRFEDARNLTTSAFRHRVGPSEFAAIAGRHPLRLRPSTLVQATMSFSDDRSQFVSNSTLRCEGDGTAPETVTLVFVTERGQLKVDRIEPCGPRSGSMGGAGGPSGR